MSYTNYHNSFKEVTSQHNIMALVGNGFDIQALSSLNSETDTKYQSFYDYLQRINFNPNNIIVKVMESAREQDLSDWCDIEAGLEKLIKTEERPYHIEEALDEIQSAFSSFLNTVITPETLHELNKLATETHRTRRSLAEFLKDIKSSEDYDRLNFLQRMNIGDVFNFRFINFNYTPLLDNFVYLDKSQFDPKPYESSDRNFEFYPNPYGFRHPIGLKRTVMASYIVSETVHPHGFQHTPRSMLFGIDSNASRDHRRLTKPYWAQNEQRHKTYFNQTHLFIVYGCSLGASDRWWWRNIACAIENAIPELDNPANLPPDLLIYWWRRSANDSKESVLRKFMAGAGRSGDSKLFDVLLDRAHVIIHDSLMKPQWLNVPNNTDKESDYPGPSYRLKSPYRL